MAEKFQLKWNDFASNVVRSFSALRNDVDFSDVTLVGDDQKRIPAHKNVLSTCSSYFKNILKDKNNEHSKVLLCLENVKSVEINDILDYIYHGEVKIFEHDIERFLAIAQRFQLDGLIGNDEAGENQQQYESFNSEELKKDDTFKDLKCDNNFLQNIQERKLASDKIIVGTLNSVEELDQQIMKNLGKDENGKPCCKICGKIAAKPCHLREHIEIHFEGLSFPCSQCNYSARYRYNLRQQKSKHRQN